MELALVGHGAACKNYPNFGGSERSGAYRSRSKNSLTKGGREQKTRFFCELPTVGFSSVFIVGGRVLLAGIASDLVFCCRAR